MNESEGLEEESQALVSEGTEKWTKWLEKAMGQGMYVNAILRHTYILTDDPARETSCCEGKGLRSGKMVGWREAGFGK